MKLKFNNDDALNLISQNMRVGRLTVAAVRNEKFLEKLRAYDFQSLDQKRLVLYGWMKICVSKDIANAIYICPDDSFRSDPSLERSIARGKTDNWVSKELIQTDNGIAVRWFLDNKTGCS